MSFIDCTTEINNTQVDNTKYLDVVMPMCSLIGYSDNFLKTSVGSYQFSRNDRHNNDITESESFNLNENYQIILKMQVLYLQKYPFHQNTYVMFGEVLKCPQLIVKLIFF